MCGIPLSQRIFWGGQNCPPLEQHACLLHFSARLTQDKKRKKIREDGRENKKRKKDKKKPQTI